MWGLRANIHLCFDPVAIRPLTTLTKIRVAAIARQH
jgi:hypothetical protein